MSIVKRFFKRNSHGVLFKALAGFGRSLNRFYENRNHDVRSNGELTIIKKISKLDPKYIVDGGANVGSYSLLLSEFNPNAKIFAFEPVQSTFKKLLLKVDSIDNITPINKGLFRENCQKEINLYPSDTHSSIVDIEGLPDESLEKQKIELIKGDDFMNLNNIKHLDFLKIDVEGAEYDALVGLNEHITKGKIKLIQFEYGYINITTKKLLIDYYRFFEQNGYKVGKIFPKQVEFRKYDYLYEDFIGPNFIAVLETETELIRLLSSK